MIWSGRYLSLVGLLTPTLKVKHGKIDERFGGDYFRPEGSKLELKR